MNKLPSYLRLKGLQKMLHAHPIYGRVQGDMNIRIFMQNHIFAVWDFMLLLKQLQRRLTCVDKIWLPPRSQSSARFINQIVIGQESDLNPNGEGYTSHFELYLGAMKEVGANTSVIQRFIASLSQGQRVETAIKDREIPEFVQEFVLNTWSSLQKPTPYVGGQFFYGRQDPIPQMFQQFVETFDKSNRCQLLRYYLRRHIEVDGSQHGPLSVKLIGELAICEDPSYQITLDGAINAIQHRIKLWDGINSRLI